MAAAAAASTPVVQPQEAMRRKNTTKELWSLLRLHEHSVGEGGCSGVGGVSWYEQSRGDNNQTSERSFQTFLCSDRSEMSRSRPADASLGLKIRRIPVNPT